jgi:hypothetical protein
MSQQTNETPTPRNTTDQNDKATQPNDTQHKRQIEDEPAYMRELLERIVDLYPQRRATSPQEKQAQALMQREFSKWDTDVQEHTFRFNDHLYANIALHFGVAVAGTASLPGWPWLALALHLLAIVSYTLDSMHKTYLLRRLFPWGESRNILATLPAKHNVRLRFVLLAHIDAAFTGWLFQPDVVKHTAKPFLGLSFLRKQLAIVIVSLLVLVGLDLTLALSGWWQPWLVWLLTIPALIALLLNLQVVIQNQTVPGANDNLSGVVALPVLLDRLQAWKPDDVELVFVSTGAEEASLGGADALARAQRDKWSTDTTIVLALDGLSSGDMFYLVEGEIIPQTIPAALREELHQTAAQHNDITGDIKPFVVPIGASDALPFVSRGYHAACIARIDTTLGAPEHYHLPSDTPEHIQYDKIVQCINFTQFLIQHIEETRT